ncbi:MAG: alpha-2-macroglobulin family protein, partial [Planctomycetota bacterium]
QEFQKGETRYYDQAGERIKEITTPTVAASVYHTFLPDSLIQFQLHWRNVKQVTLALYAVTLIEEVDFDRGDWEHGVDIAGRPKLRTWARATEDKGAYKPGADTIVLDEKLPVGAYIVRTEADGAAAHQALILVTDMAVVLKTAPSQALVYCCDAFSGAPLADVDLVLWELDSNRKGRRQTGRTNADGLAVFATTQRRDYHMIRVAALRKDRQALCNGQAWWERPDRPEWRIYATTDRPAYRPGDTVQWKFTARVYDEGKYRTPASEKVQYRIYDARGALIKDETVKLNDFGSAWGALALTDQMPLGEFRIEFTDTHNVIGSSTLFRLEEYKLPEYKVTVSVPTGERGERKMFRVGDTVEVRVQAEYYFGGAVSDADVHLLVYQRPFQHFWRPPREFEWLYEGAEARQWEQWGGPGQLIKDEKLRTDAGGAVLVRFETPRGASQDFEYTIEARVTDAARREITGKDRVRVTRQGYYVYLNPEHYLFLPQDRVKIDVQTMDANEKGVAVSGEIEVTRDRWREVWVSPDGAEVRGEELEALRTDHARRTGDYGWPPPPKPGAPPWELKFRGYEREKILTQTVQTDAAGKAEFVFTPEREGYYQIAWSSPDAEFGYVHTSTYVWVTTKAATDIGYRPGGVQIIVDKDTIQPGRNAPVMLTTPTNDRYVLFCVQADDLYSYQVVHVTGTAKLLEVPITEQHCPNVYLQGALVTALRLFAATEYVVVPPVRQFINVEVQADQEVYEPRSEGTLTVRTTGHDGQPIAAEVSLGLADASVFYIQEDYAGDPRRFYWGRTRRDLVTLQSTFQVRQYAKLVRGEDGNVFDERELRQRQEWRRAGAGGGGAAGQVVCEANMVDLGGRFDADGLDDQRYGWFARRDAAASQPMSAAAGARGMFQNGSGGPADRIETWRFLSPSSEDEGVQIFFTAGTGGFVAPEAVQVRSDFRATVFWQPDVKTDADGRATVKVKYPDSLTTWRATARAATTGTQVGIATAETRTRQPLIIRLQAPRFFLVGDTVVVSAVLNNNTDGPLEVLPGLEAAGIEVQGYLKSGQWVAGEPAAVSVPAKGETRVDWRVRVVRPGEAKLKVVGRGKKHADAMERTLPIFEHGMDKLVAKSGKVRGDDVTIRLELPKERKADTTTLTVQVTPSIAVTMLDALPYLVDYPYGCTEQTMSRFLPAVVVAKTLADLGLEREIVANRLFGGIEQDPANLKRLGQKNLEQLDEVVRQSLERLYDLQHTDGGWAWWKYRPEDPSDHFMSAYVVWGLALAREAGIGVRDDVLSRGVEYLRTEIVEAETQPDLQAFMLHALAVHHAVAKAEATKFEQTAFGNLYKQRDALNAYTRALLALCAHHYGKAEPAQVLIRNLENGVKRDERPDTSVIMEGAQESHAGVVATAHWGEDGIYWRWSDGGVEATAFALRALLAVDPQNKLIEPVTNWLVKNRRGAQWNSTRDTAMVVLALNDYLRVSGELKPEMEYEVLVNGQLVATRKVTAADGLNAPSRIAVDRQHLKDGANEIRIRRSAGKGPIYFAAEARFYSLECPITPVGHEIFVRRQYYRLVQRPTLLRGLTYEKVPLNDGDTVVSGERVETVLTIEGKNNYEYLVFEDLKPAGLEAVQVRSGEACYVRELKSGAVERQFGTQTTAQRTSEEHMTRDQADYTGRQRWVHQELRDRKVALFIDKLPEGVWEVRYELRAEAPGEFHALPTVGYAMYVPEIRCNGTEVRVIVHDAK